MTSRFQGRVEDSHLNCTCIIKARLNKFKMQMFTHVFVVLAFDMEIVVV